MNSISRGLAAVSIAGLATLAVSGPAFAQQGSFQVGSGTVSDSTAQPGQAITAESGDGVCLPGEQGTATVFGRTTPATANALGELSLTFTVPAGTAPGAFTVDFACAARTVRVPFSVVAATATTTGNVASGRTGAGALPRTGSDEIVPLTALGLGLVGAGAGMVVVARRRRATGGFAA